MKTLIPSIIVIRIKDDVIKMILKLFSIKINTESAINRPKPTPEKFMFNLYFLIDFKHINII